jgi:hypothetical protein
MATPDKGAAITLLVPSTATLDDGSVIRVDTAYPFEDTVRVSCAVSKSTMSLPLYIRVPEWAANATINGKPVPAGNFSKHACARGGSRGAPVVFVLELRPAIMLEEWAGDGHGGDAPNIAYSVVPTYFPINQSVYRTNRLSVITLLMLLFIFSRLPTFLLFANLHDDE